MVIYNRTLKSHQMITTLLEVEKILHTLLINNKLHSMYIDYHKPFVSRIWFQYGENRVYLHKIEKCLESSEALYHPHPWESAIRIISGHYEMGVGHSTTEEQPKTDCRLILPTSSLYEMTEPDAWHYVNPLDEPVYSLMVTGKRNGRTMPIEPKKEFRQLTTEECSDILISCNNYYKWGISAEEITSVAIKIAQGIN